MFEKDLIVFSEEAFAKKDEVIEAMARLAVDKVTDVNAYADAVRKREAAFCTYIDHEVAIPHGKTDAVKTPFVIYQRMAEGVIWGEEDERARHVFMIGVPAAAAGNLHLKILAELSKALIRDEFRTRLFDTASEEEAFEVLKAIEEAIVL